MFYIPPLRLDWKLFSKNSSYFVFHSWNFYISYSHSNILVKLHQIQVVYKCLYVNPSFHPTISIWHIFIAFSAFSWLSGVTPAQHAASTMIGTSGRAAFTRSALEITQISVQSPINVILPISSSIFIATSSSARSVEPKVSLSIGSVFLSLSSSLLICHPSVFRMQCGTGSFFPS